MNVGRDLCIGVLLGWGISMLLVASVLILGMEKAPAPTELVEQMDAAVRQENNGCHECGDTTAVFRCQLFFECALQLTKGGNPSRIAAKLQASGFFIFDRVDVCGATVVGGGLFNFRFVPLEPDCCIPAFTANATWFEEHSLQAMQVVLTWSAQQQQVNKKPTSTTISKLESLPSPKGLPFQETLSEAGSSPGQDRSRASARDVAGELSIRVPLVSSATGSLSAATIARGGADGHVVSADDHRVVPVGAEIVAMDGSPSDASLVLQQAAAETGGGIREVVLVLAFEPSAEDIDKRGADALNIYVPPPMRRQITPGWLRTPAGYSEWGNAMRASGLLPQLQLQFINKATPLLLAVDGIFDRQTAQAIIDFASPKFRRSTVGTLKFQLEQLSLLCDLRLHFALFTKWFSRCRSC
eukprot:COSAG02_NODE_3068_length_7430_cov_2.999864_7_plen_412_part_00